MARLLLLSNGHGEDSEQVVKEYFEKKIDLNKKKFDNSLLKEPFFLNN